jgi:hypothetical protein
MRELSQVRDRPIALADGRTVEVSLFELWLITRWANEMLGERSSLDDAILQVTALTDLEGRHHDD